MGKMGKKRVLVVDDGITMRMFYRDVLENAGFEVDEAVNGMEGLEKALLAGCDAMLVDVNMPKMDGYQMIDQVRKQPDLCEVPIITISSEAQEQDAARAYEAGANLYIVKPADPDELVETVKLLTGMAA
jgi:two-component system, chemotaxis family, chemotaxis protein CheY